MSLVIGIHLGELVMLAADKRVVTVVDDELLHLSDDADKILDVGIGHHWFWLRPLLEPVKYAMVKPT